MGSLISRNRKRTIGAYHQRQARVNELEVFIEGLLDLGFMATNREIILASALIATIVVAAVIIMVVSVRVPNVGRIKAVGVAFFKDANCTQNLTSIDWGTCTPGNTYGVVTFCKNTRNTNVTLNLTVTNWNPTNASIYLAPSWNYTSGTIIQPSAVLPIQFELAVSQNITGIDTFSFDFNIAATEYPIPTA